MKLDIKLVVILLIIAVHCVNVEAGWGRVVRSVGRVARRAGNGIRRVVRKAGNGIRRVARKAGNGIKTGVRKTGEGLKKAGEATGKGLKKAGEATGKGLKKAGEATGEGLKKAGEGIKKAGEVTGKHLYKGLRETGKALITASNFVGEILDRINLMKFIWKKLGACCIPIPPLCSVKNKYNRVRRELKRYNKIIDDKWKKVEYVFQWLDKVNDNIEDIAYHVDRITSGAEDVISPLAPPLMIQYNTKMNSIKQDVKWKNHTVIDLTRQAATTFVAIEMAWKCPKVYTSIKSGLSKLREAKKKCQNILQKSNNFLNFLNQGLTQMLRELRSSKLRDRLQKIEALCLDSSHTFCVSATRNFLRQIPHAGVEKAFELQEDLLTALSAMKYTYSCLKRKQKVLTTVTKNCQQGNENFHSVFLQALVDFFPNSDACIGLVNSQYTTKADVLHKLQIEANKHGFCSSCSLNSKAVKERTCLNYSAAVTSFELPPVEKSRLLIECKKIVPTLGALRCNSHVCKNGGTCLEQADNSYVCECAKGFSGSHCEVRGGGGLLPYKTVGCYQDRPNRAIPVVEGQDAILDGSHYKSRTDAIDKCYQVAKKRGNQVFAIQDGGHCQTGPSAAKSFNKYGPSTACHADGKGGPWVNQVYYINDFVDMGCYRDSGNRAIAPIEGTDAILDGSYRSRQNALVKCALAARRAGFTMFAVQNSGWCASSASAQNTYGKHGKATNCGSDGEGGPWANEVYILKASTLPYETLGCFQDRGARAIAQLDGHDPLLQGGYHERENAIEKCYLAAKKRGFNVFAVQNGGWCAASATAEKTFDKYGRSSACHSNGKGGPWANQVYYIKDYTEVGCYRDNGDRAIATIERTDAILDGPYRSRMHAITKCAVAAKRKGYTAFALQNGGWCAASAQARSTYHKYGKSSVCKPDGRGGPWANQVYVF